MAARGLPGRDEPPESVTQLSDDLEELIGSFDLQGWHSAIHMPTLRSCACGMHATCEPYAILFLSLNGV